MLASEQADRIACRRRAKVTTKNAPRKKLGAEMSIRWCRIVGLGCVVSACFVSSGIALIGSHSPVSRSLSSSNYTPFPLLFCLPSLFSSCFG